MEIWPTMPHRLPTTPSRHSIRTSPATHPAAQAMCRSRAAKSPDRGSICPTAKSSHVESWVWHRWSRFAAPGQVTIPGQERTRQLDQDHVHDAYPPEKPPAASTAGNPQTPMVWRCTMSSHDPDNRAVDSGTAKVSHECSPSLSRRDRKPSSTYRNFCGWSSITKWREGEMVTTLAVGSLARNVP